MATAESGTVPPLKPAETATLVDQGTAAYLDGDHTRAVQLLQSAYQSARAAEDTAQSLYCAFLIAIVCGTTGQPALFNGWLAKTRRLLAEQHDEPGHVTAGQGYVAVLEIQQELSSGGFAKVADLAERVLAAADAEHDADLMALGLVALGRSTIYAGDVLAGLQMVDEAMATVLSGECRPIPTGLAWCAAIEACQEIGAIDRVCEWTTALARWRDGSPSAGAFSGECSLHTGQVLALHGAWTEAIEEFSTARRRLEENARTQAAGAAERERGDLFRIRGELREAEACYQAAAEHGCDPQPGLALLWLVRGQHNAAYAAIVRRLEEGGPSPEQVPLLPAALEILLTVGRRNEAEQLLRHIDELAWRWRSTTLLAAGAYAHACLELSGHDPQAAVPYARKSLHGWNELGCPFEVARCQMLLGSALKQLGDHNSYIAELKAAGSTFRLLGAAPYLLEVTDLLRMPETADGRAPGLLTTREVQVLQLVASGCSNKQIAAELCLSDKTVARHLSNIFGKIDVGSRTAAAAYAYENQLV